MIEAAAAEMAEIGWPGVEVRRWANGSWVAAFFRYTDDSLCTIKAQGKGKILAEAIKL